MVFLYSYILLTNIFIKFQYFARKLKFFRNFDDLTEQWIARPSFRSDSKIISADAAKVISGFNVGFFED